MRVTIGAKTTASSLKTHGFNLSGPTALFGFEPERSFLMPSSVISKGSIWASFMACLLSCSRDSGEGAGGWGGCGSRGGIYIGGRVAQTVCR